jgi:hypothetical protein
VVRLLRRILLRLRRAVVLAVVVLAVIAVLLVAVAGMTDTLAVSVVLVALAVAVMSVVRLVVLRRMARAIFVVVAIGRFSDPGLRGRGDPAANRTLGGSDPREGRGSRRARRGPAGRRRHARACRGRLPRGARWRRRPRRSGSDDRRDVAGSGRWSGDCGLVAGQIEKPRRGQDEADGCQYGEHAGQWCGYARKATPHKCPIGAPAPILNLNGGIGLHDPSARIFCSMRAFVGAWETHPSRSEWPFPAARERPLLLNIT